MDSALLIKANTIFPTFIGTVTTPNLSVTNDTTVNNDATINGNLYVIGTGKCITAKKIQAAPSSNLALSGIVVLDSTLSALSGASLGNTTFTGTVDGLTKSMVQLSNVDNTSDLSKPVSTATQTALNNKQSTLNVIAPLIKTLNIISNTMEVSIDPTSDMAIRNLTTSGTLVSTGDASISGTRANVVSNITNSQTDGYSSLYFNNTSGSTPQAETAQIFCGQTGGLNITTNTAHSIKLNANRFAAGSVNSIEIQGTGTRNVLVNAPLLYKPYVSLLVTTTSGVVSVTNFGYCTLTASSITRVGTGSKAYSITLPAAHPYGANFAVFATAQTGSSSTWDGTNDFIVTAKVETGGTAISVWCRRPGISGATASGFTDGSFYVHSVP